MERTCRWCERTFELPNEFRWLCDECYDWSRKPLPGIKRFRRVFTTNKPRHFEALHAELGRAERALDASIKAECRQARKVDGIIAIRDAILTGRAGSWYHGKSRDELARLAK